MHRSFKKYLSNTSWLFFANGLKLFSNFFLSIFIIRYLGAEKFGILSYAISFVGLFSAFSSFRLDSIVVKELLNKQEEKNEIYGTAFIIKILGCIFVSIIILTYIHYSSLNFVTKIVFVFILLGLFFQNFKVIDFYFQSKVLLKYSSIVIIYKEIILSLFKIGLIIANCNLIWFAFALTLDHILFAIGLLYMYMKKGENILNWKIKKSLFFQFIKESYPLVLSGVLATINIRIDQIMIKFFLGFEAVGKYAAATRFNQMINLIPILIATSLFPAIVNSKKNNEEVYHSRLQFLYDLMVLITFSIGIPAFVFSKQIILLIYGNDFYESIIVFQIYIWVTIFVFLGVIRGRWIVIENLQHLSLIYNSIAVIYNITANYFLIPVYGIKAAAWNSLVAMFLSIYLLNLCNKKTYILFVMISKSFYHVVSFKFVKRLINETKNIETRSFKN
ncbi:MAG: flippase [Candidatus Cloacimonetes bacterium]|nr:flippase [Candidatus Cloacimonadota bacterium]